MSLNIENKEEVFRELDVDLKLRLTLDELRIFSRYIEGELLYQLEERGFKLEEIENLEETDKNNKLKIIVETLANGIYKGLIDTEKLIIDELKERYLTREEVIESLSGDEYDRERIENIYDAMDELKEEEKEAKNIYEKLDIYGKVVLSKVREVTKDLYLPLIYKFYWFLHNSMDKTGEVVFTENSIEELLNLDREGIEMFLDGLSTIEVKIGNKRERIVDYYSYLNETTLKIEYSIFAVNPIKYWDMDESYEIGKIEEIEVTRI